MEQLKVGKKTYSVKITWPVLMGYHQRTGENAVSNPAELDPEAFVWAIWAAVKAGERAEGRESDLTLRDVEYAENGLEMFSAFIPIFTRGVEAITKK